MDEMVEHIYLRRPMKFIIKTLFFAVEPPNDFIQGLHFIKVLIRMSSDLLTNFEVLEVGLVLFLLIIIFLASY